MSNYIPPSVAGAVHDVPQPSDDLEQLDLLIRVMARLRRPDGCPWDRAQTHQSLLPNLLEETYEYLHAVRTGDIAAMKEELGDLLLQVIFHAQIAEEAGEFNLGDSARDLSEKLVRRHPHVFGDDRAADQAEALASWHKAKRGEGAHTLDLDKVPRAMPALTRARKVQNKAAKVGFQWPDVEGAMAKIDEELRELKAAIGAKVRKSESAKVTDLGASFSLVEEEIGDLLFAVVNVARYLHVDPEVALIGTIEKFIRRFKYIESRLAEEGIPLAEAGLEKMDGYWEESKRLLSSTQALGHSGTS